jgi:hypothetical protein
MARVPNGTTVTLTRGRRVQHCRTQRQVLPWNLMAPRKRSPGGGLPTMLALSFIRRFSGRPRIEVPSGSVPVAEAGESTSMHNGEVSSALPW